MSKKQTLGIGLALVATASVVLMFSVKTKKDKRRRSHDVAEEGYETAHDVLFPLRIQRLKKKDLIK
jgi:hypothetical protein